MRIYDRACKMQYAVRSRHATQVEPITGMTVGNVSSCDRTNLIGFLDFQKCQVQNPETFNQIHQDNMVPQVFCS